MSNETSGEIKTETILGAMKEEDLSIKEESSKLDHSKSFDINDQNELDYEELDVPKLPVCSASDAGEVKKPNEAEASDDGAIEDSDGEVKSDGDSDGEINEGEVDAVKEPEVPEEEEDGEINDGEKVKKAFIPRVLCKYYQRGKCTWGRTCKFLHPGVNDTGNYSFLEFQDPNAKVYEQAAAVPSDLDSANAKEAEFVEPEQTETAWERGLRHAREMKEKAKARKLLEKETFEDKKMNLSLKEFENEKENDERYFNVEKMPTNDSEEDEDLHLFAQSGRLNTDRSSSNQAYRSSAYSNDRDTQYQSRYSDDKHSSQYSNRQNDYRSQDKSEGSMGRRQSPFMGGNRARADDWHDPWDRSNSKKKPAQRRDRSNSYSSSGSDSRSRSRSGSRSSYSSRSSRSYSSGSSRSDSSRSGSASPSRNKSKGSKHERQSRQLSRSDKGKAATNPKQLTSDLKKKIESLKKASVKPLPGRQISDVSLKKAGLESDKSSSRRSKKMNSRSRSHSSVSSYESSDSKSDDDDFSNDDSDSYSDDDDNYKSSKDSASKRIKQQHSSKGLKRSANDSKLGTDSKKSKSDKGDKKQMIKDELKRLESALKKKSMTK